MSFTLLILVIGLLTYSRRSKPRLVKARDFCLEDRAKRALSQAEQDYITLGCEPALARAYAKLDKFEAEGRI